MVVHLADIEHKRSTDTKQNKAKRGKLEKEPNKQTNQQAKARIETT